MENDARPWKEAMRPVNYEVMFDVEDDHWWFVGRRAIVFALIDDALQKSAAVSRRIILDIGCGTGATMDHLKRYGEVQGIDLSELPLRFSRKRGHSRVMLASATELPFADNSFDLLTALDVIEHLDDDVRGLGEIRRVLKPGAPAVIFVPAFQALWGPNDDQSGHKRRYRLEGLKSAATAAGLTIEHISYANIAMFLPIWIGRKILQLFGREEQAENRINNPLINKLLSRIFTSEAGWLRRRSLPFGVSIVCVVRKEI
ncbi:MAG: class I SAM-dependent methyltransferase [Acidobacteria bacterium]|nr:class I SAM-dependent methyltransferase [Acidobacteriota bacterium]MBK9707677.1 class I SAM-dependent methyltransferase [Acidobacteriota bacterium]